MARKRELIATRWERPDVCVVIPGDFVNTPTWIFFADEREAKRYIRDEGEGRIVDEDGLANEFKKIHCAEGRFMAQDSSGRHVDIPDDVDAEEWMEELWEEEYAESAAYEFDAAREGYEFVYRYAFRKE